MAIDFDEGPSREGQGQLDYSLSATQLVSRTFGVWIKKLPLYLVILGGFLVLFQILEIAVGYFVFGEIYSGGLLSDPTSFMTQIIYYTFYPSSMPEEFWLLISVSGIFLVLRLIVLAVVVGAVVKLAISSYTSDTGDLGSSISSAFSRIIPMVIAILIINMIVAVLLAPGTAMLTGALDLIDPSDPYSMAGFEELMSAMGLTLVMMIPILFIVVRLAPIYAVISEEDVSATEGFSRAYNITGGNFLHIFGGWFLLYIIKLILDIGISVFADPLILGLGTSLGLAIYNLLSLWILTPLDFIFFAVLYMDLESRSRGGPSAYW